MATNVLVLGAKGYIGGSVLASLVKSYPDVKFNAVIRMSTTGIPDNIAQLTKHSETTPVSRSLSIADKFRAIGVEPVIGSLDDHELVTKLSAEADIVINVADCDSVDLLNQLECASRGPKGQEGTRKDYCGISIFMDNSGDGKFNTTGKVWTDSEEDIRALTTSMIHGQVDVPLLKASEARVVNSFIICPSGVYGKSTGPIERNSIIFRLAIADYLKQKHVYYIGEGSNRSEWVHLEDAVSLFDKIFELALDALSTRRSTNPYERYYIVSTTPIEWKGVAERFARDLNKQGLVESSKPAAISSEGLNPLNRILASNVNTRGICAEELLGWKPKHVAFSEEAFDEQIEFTLKSLD